MAWAPIVLGLFVVMIGQLDHFMLHILDIPRASLLWPAVVVGSTLAGLGALLLVGVRLFWEGGSRSRSET
jgi:hypothetical protein